MKHRTVNTSAEYYSAIPTRFKLQAKIVLERWAKEFLDDSNSSSFDEFVVEIVPHFYECWRININRQVAKSLFISAIQKVDPNFNVEHLA